MAFDAPCGSGELMPGTLASLLIKLGLDATGVEQGVARAEKSIGGLSTGAGTAMKVAGTLIGGGLAFAAKGALEMEDRAGPHEPAVCRPPARWWPGELAAAGGPADLEARPGGAGTPRHEHGPPGRPAPTMLHCAACGTRLIGDNGYYRHRHPCEPFIAAKPAKRRGLGTGDRQEWYEGLVEQLLERVTLDEPTIAQVVGAVADPVEDRLALARVERERDQSLRRYRHDRDAEALGAAMSRLDAEEPQAREPAATSMAASEVVGYLRDLPSPGSMRPRAGPGSPTRCSSASTSSASSRPRSTSPETRSVAALRPRCRFRARVLFMVGARGIEPTGTT